jgi:MscS family membrane protein
MWSDDVPVNTGPRDAVAGGLTQTRQRSSRARGAASVWVAALLIGLALPAAAQTGTQSAQTSKAAPEPGDPLGRDTPRGTITGLNRAVHRGDFVVASRYMQIAPAQRPDTEQLARDLTDLIDRFYIGPITSLSGAREGTLTDGLPPDRERVVLTIAGKPIEIELVRVTDPQWGLVWLISSPTLAKVPALRQSAEARWFERGMPEALVDATVFGVSVARWIGWAIYFVVPFAALWFLSIVFIVIARRLVTEPARRTLLDLWHARLRRPVILVMTLGIQLAGISLLGFSLRFRLVFSRIALVLLVFAATWLLWRLMALGFADARLAAQRRGQASIRSLLLLAERVCKSVLVLVAIFALLTIAGVDTTTALAGVGLGGVAVALGAQKSVENLLGGFFLLTDGVLAVGDTCSISNRVGVVEDITMRSVRLRTAEQTLLSVPAGILSQSSLENFATRDKILMQSTLRLRYGTTASQLRRVLTGIRSLLHDHPDVETSTARIRLMDFGVRAIELELFAYVLSSDWLKFLAVREDLFLQIAALVESSGTGFAQPTVVYQEPAPTTETRMDAPDDDAPARRAASGGA